VHLPLFLDTCHIHYVITNCNICIAQCKTRNGEIDHAITPDPSRYCLWSGVL